jgi:hypothetical protein
MGSSFGLLLFIAAAMFPVMLSYNRRSGVTRSRPSPWIYALAIVPGIVFILFLQSGPTEARFLLSLIALGGLALFLLIWVREIVQLMGLSDDVFPGRNDKSLWLALMVLMPPIGVPAFSIFRRAYWPSEKPVADAGSRDLA